MLLKAANIGKDAGVVDAHDKEGFIAAAKTRRWDRISLYERWQNRAAFAKGGDRIRRNGTGSGSRAHGIRDPQDT